MSRTIIDLSHPLETGKTPAYPGDPVEFTSKPAFTHERDGCALSVLSLGTHTGTHLDAPSHFVPGGATVDQLDLSLLVARMVLIDLRELVNGQARRRLDWVDLAPWHDQIATCGQHGGILVLRTGWSAFWVADSHKYTAHPYITRDAAEGLVRAGVRVLAVDTFSPDETLGEPETDFGAHKVLLGAEKPCIIVENIKLEALDGVWREEQEWTVSILPMNLVGLDGSPVRAVAWRTVV